MDKEPKILAPLEKKPAALPQIIKLINKYPTLPEILNQGPNVLLEMLTLVDKNTMIIPTFDTVVTNELEKYMQSNKPFFDCDPAYCDPDFGFNLLHTNIVQKDLPLIVNLINSGVKLNKQDHMGYTPLHWAVICKADDILAYLIHKGAELNTKDSWGNTPLHCAVIRSNLAAIECLVKNGAELTLKNNDGHTPLYLATIRKNSEIILCLGQAIWNSTPEQKLSTCSVAPPSSPELANEKISKKRKRDPENT